MKWLYIALLLTLTLHSSAADRLYADKEVKAGLALSEADARKIEKKVLSGKGNALERMRLLAWYTTRIDSPEAAEIRAKRIPQILWFVKETGAYIRPYQNACVAAIYRDGDAFADKAGYEQVKAAWLGRLAREPINSVVADQAVRFIYPEEPEEAFRIAAKAAHAPTAGEVAGRYLAGSTRVRYRDCKPERSDPGARETTVGRIIMNSVAQSSMPVFLASFAGALARHGAAAYREGKLNWDYIPLANDARSRALDLMPGEAACWAEPYALAQNTAPSEPSFLPESVTAARILHQPKPAYPPEAKANGRQGKVQFDALIGCSGNIIWLGIIDGPAEFIAPSLNAVRQWLYQPTRIDDKPVMVSTVMEVNYSLRY